MLWGMYISYKKKDQPWGLLVLALMIGVLLSSPLVPPRDASKMRVYAVTQPVLITVAAIGLVDICQSLAKKSKAFTFFKSVETTTLKNNNDKSRNLVLTGVILAAVIFISPIAARLNGKTPEPIKSTCPSHLEEKQFRFNPGSSIELVEGTTASMTWAGIRVPVHRFKSNLEEICVSSEKEIAKMIDLGFLQPGDVLLEPAFLNQDGNLLLLVISSNEIPSNAAYLTICGEEKNGVFYSQFIER